MACYNPKAVNDGKTLNFGFSTVFNPYLKTVTFDRSGLSTFTSTTGVYFSFKITDPNGSDSGALTYGSGGMDVATGDTSKTIALTTGGILFYGTYTITARCWKDGSHYTDLVYTVEVCYDSRLNNDNSITGCITVDTNCSTAYLTIKEQTNFKYNGLSPDSKSYAGTLDYPNNYLSQKAFSYVPYSVSLDGSITGLYQIKVTTTARYDLGCYAYLDVTYISQDNPQVTCSGALSTILCCWTQSMEIANRGGTIGAAMADKLQEAAPIFNMALLQEFNGKNSEVSVKELQRLLGCDCKCQAGLTIQANPILLNGKNVIGECGTTVTDGEDITIHSYNIVIGTCDSGTGFSFTQTTNGCNKEWCMTVDITTLTQNVYNEIAGDSDTLILWKDLLNDGCPCKTSVTLISQTGQPPTEAAPLSFSQVVLCNGNILTFDVELAESIADIVKFLNDNSTTNDYGVFSASPDGTGIVTTYDSENCNITIYLYETCSTTIIVNGDDIVIASNRFANYYTVLDDMYFTKSDRVVSFTLTDESGITGGTLSSIEISETTTGGSATVSTLGDDFNLVVTPATEAAQCGTALVAKTGTMTQALTTTKNCTQSMICATSYQRIPYSERHGIPYRMNPQINDLPYYGDYIYLNETSLKGEGVIRTYNCETSSSQYHETRQIAGKSSQTGTPTTVTNVTGDAVEYLYPSGVYADKATISNSHATLYFATFGGCICKLVRTSTTNCDERANWTNYIIAGGNRTGTTSVESGAVLGSAFSFNTPYGLKRFGTINGQPSFIVDDHGNSRYLLLYYNDATLVASPNLSTSWSLNSMPALTWLGNININTELDITGASKPCIYMYGAGGISKQFYKGSLTSLTEIRGTSGGTYWYAPYTICATGNGVPTDGTGDVAIVHNPIFLSQINYDGKTVYVFCEEYAGGGYPPAGYQTLRGFYANASPIYSADTAAEFTFITVVTDNSAAYSKFGNRSAANGLSEGMFYHPTKSRYLEFSFAGGIRTLASTNTTQAIVTGTGAGNIILYANESGGAAANADGTGAAPTASDTTTGVVDTNYKLKITCPTP